MTELPTTNATVTMTVPMEKVTAAAMSVMEEYAPIVEEAVKELKYELLSNADFRRVIKDKLKENLKSMIAQETERHIKSAVDSVYYEKFGKIEQSVRDILSENV